MTIRILNWLYAALAAAVLAGCASSGVRAPVSDIGSSGQRPSVTVTESVTTTTHVRKSLRAGDDWRPQTYVVQKGDTLYGIAFNYGLDYHDIAELNNIQNAEVIHAGQELRLFPADTAAKPAAAEIKPQGIPVKDQPRMVKLPYSESALAKVQKMQEVPQKPAAAPEAKPAPKPEPGPETSVASVAAEGELEWGMPTRGKVVAGFSESANRKGIDIAGKLGQPVMASAAGKVVYSGSGLRGYGKLVIIKHNSTYLSAYAHNNKILVKEGQAVSKGQKIAEMGNTDASQVELHFEIRKLGKPVDPAQYLSKAKS